MKKRGNKEKGKEDFFSKNLGWFVAGFIFLLAFVVFIYNYDMSGQVILGTPSSPTDTVVAVGGCYQEQADAQTAGDGNCNLSYSGSYTDKNKRGKPKKIHDAKWKTYGLLAIGFGKGIEAVYNFPSGSSVDGAWLNVTVYKSRKKVNYAIDVPDACLRQDKKIKWASFYTKPARSQRYINFSCFNDSDSLVPMEGIDVSSGRFYEEAVMWGLTPLENECWPAGNTTCSDSTSFQNCTDVNRDGYLEWSSEINCPADRPVCDDSSGAARCVVSCTNECNDGDKRCALSSNAYQECEENANGCWIWGSLHNCDSGQICSNGECEPAGDFLDAEYRFGSNFLADENNNYDLTNQGNVAQATISETGNSYASFSGQNYFEVTGSNSENPNRVSFSAWINPQGNSKQNQSEIVSKWSDSVMNKSFIFGINAEETNTLFAKVTIKDLMSGKYYHIIKYGNISSYIAENKFFHVAAVFDGNDVSLYANGERIAGQYAICWNSSNNVLVRGKIMEIVGGSQTICREKPTFTNTEILGNNNPILIGARNLGNHIESNWTGGIDEVKIKGYALTLSEILNMYNDERRLFYEVPTQAENAIAYYLFEKNLKDNLTGESLSSTIVLHDHDYSSIGNCNNFFLETSSGNSTEDNPLILYKTGSDSNRFGKSGPFSISFWTRFDDDNGAYSDIISKYENYMISARNGALGFAVKKSDGGWAEIGYTQINIGEWIFVTAVYDGSDIYLFVNGQEVVSDSAGSLASPQSGKNFVIFSNEGDGTGTKSKFLQSCVSESLDNSECVFHGAIDELIIWNMSLTSENISNLYSDSDPYGYDYGSGYFFNCTGVECTDDADCGSGESCVSGVCTGGVCTDDADCGSGERCVSGACTAQACVNDSDCPSGQTCANGGCSGTGGAGTFEFEIATCEDSACVDEADVFTRGQRVYFDFYVSDDSKGADLEDENELLDFVENMNVTAVIDYPGTQTSTIKVPGNLTFNTVGDYQVTASARKPGYQTIISRINFSIESADQTTSPEEETTEEITLPPGEECNYNGRCERSIGETNENCPDDCPAGEEETDMTMIWIIIAIAAAVLIAGGIIAYVLWKKRNKGVQNQKLEEEIK